MLLEATPTTPAEFYIPERALVIVAHADDIEFGASGTIARWTDGGCQVTYCIVTDNGAGSNKPDTIPSQLMATRRAEQIASAEVVGVTDVRFLNYTDGMLEPTLALRKDLTRIIRQVRPQVVITLDPTSVIIEAPDFVYINHPDHRATGEAALYAVFPSAGTRLIFPELLAEGLEPHSVDYLYLAIGLQGSLVVDITAVHDRKLEALSKHQSQLTPEDLEFVTRFDTEAGKAHGYTYAESFRMLKLGE
ncbi:MAG: PIG-L family deacetylase [Armatimonadetes bacterium]|nr:PIG-L family deacetylase [Anaerolineae bacterium]